MKRSSGDRSSRDPEIHLSFIIAREKTSPLSFSFYDRKKKSVLRARKNALHETTFFPYWGVKDGCGRRVKPDQRPEISPTNVGGAPV